jgi:hypothetical protein
MVFVIVGVLMFVHRRLMGVFGAAVAVGHLFMGVLMHMLVFVFMGVSMMSFIVGVFMFVHRRLVGVFGAFVAMGQFLMGVFMFMLVLLGHGLSSLIIYFYSPANR